MNRLKQFAIIAIMCVSAPVISRLPDHWTVGADALNEEALDLSFKLRSLHTKVQETGVLTQSLKMNLDKLIDELQQLTMKYETLKSLYADSLADNNEWQDFNTAMEKQLEKARETISALNELHSSIILR